MECCEAPSKTSEVECVSCKRKCEDVYDIQEIIGAGAFSDVVLAVHRITRKEVAIKIIDKRNLQTERQMLRMRNEINLHKYISAFGHPNIVHFIEAFESDEDICLVMELCKGGELFERIRKKKYFLEKECCHIMMQILCSVRYLHALDIVHRDIKPENLLYVSARDDSPIKLADFGFSKQLKQDEFSLRFEMDEDTDESDTVKERSSDCRQLLKASLTGTSAYCAPERLSQMEESKAVDIWSCGCIMYFLLFGVPPFYSDKENEEENENEIYDSVLEGTIRFPEDRIVSDNAKDLVLRLLEKDPVMRITAEQALEHPWIQQIDSLPLNRNQKIPCYSSESRLSEYLRTTDRAEKPAN